MRRFFFGLAMLGIATVAPGWALAGDQEIAQEVIQKLEEQKQAGQLKGFRLGVSVKDGHVWLKGRTTSPDQRDMVLKLAQRVAGVKAVVNEVEITTEAPASAAATNPGLAGAWQTNVGTAPPASIPSRKIEATRAPSAANVEIHKRPTATFASDTSLAQPASVARADFAVGPGTVQRIPTEGNQQGSRFTSDTQESPTPARPANTASSRNAVTSQAAPQRSALTGPPVANSSHMGAPHPNQMPLPYGGRQVAYNQPGMPGQPIPAYVPMAGGNQVAPARYDHPRMPGYAWPSYAAYPNYAAVTYPRQYSPTAWPYIGPFYPYPQVPLGWRKVSLEWDDGWWMLDFWEK